MYPDSVLLTGNDLMGWKCIAYLMLNRPYEDFYNSRCSLGSCFFFCFGWRLLKKKKSGVHFFVFANIMFSKCRIWLDVSWSLLVKWFIFREFLKIMTKAGIKIASYRSREREIAVQAKVAPPGQIMSFFPWTSLQFRKNVFRSHFSVGYQLKDFSIKCEGHMRGGIYKKKKKKNYSAKNCSFNF